MSFLVGLTPATAEQLERIGQRRHVGAGEMIIHAGDPETHLYLVLSGELKVLTSQGGVPIGPGEVVGEMAFLDQSPRSADVQASGPAELLVIERDAVLRQFSGNPERIAELTESLQAVRDQRMRTHGSCC
jgi:CRP-like cAMP-binding protein